jgi:uncharacterized membrane protein YeaQ/YmgE (transglycosylase-associated protein family)
LLFCNHETKKLLKGNKNMNLLAWIVLGFLAGAIAKVIYPGRQGGGFLATVLLGIIGAFIGGSLGTFLSTGTLAVAAPTLSIPGIAIAVLGAIIAIFLWNSMNRRSVV